jgi:hypothetical protein
MPDLVQLNLSVDPDLKDRFDNFAEDRGWSKRELVTTGFYALARLMERLDPIAQSAPEEAVGALFAEVARQMPGDLVGAKVGWGQMSDGRFALIFNDEWWIAKDANGELMAARPDGTAVGQIAHGTIEPLARVVIEGDVKPLQEPPAEAALT